MFLWPEEQGWCGAYDHAAREIKWKSNPHEAWTWGVAKEFAERVLMSRNAVFSCPVLEAASIQCLHRQVNLIGTLKLQVDATNKSWLERLFIASGLLSCLLSYFLILRHAERVWSWLGFGVCHRLTCLGSGIWMMILQEFCQVIPNKNPSDVNNYVSHSIIKESWVYVYK